MARRPEPPPDPSDRLASLRALMAERAEAPGATLREQLARAGRALPARLRRDGRFLADAEAMSRHPRMARLVDPREEARAAERLSRHLLALDPAAARRRRRLDLLALWAFYVLVAGALAVALLWWRGLA